MMRLKDAKYLRSEVVKTQLKIYEQEEIESEDSKHRIESQIKKPQLASKGQI